jgi:general secretion pathway protein D
MLYTNAHYRLKPLIRLITLNALLVVWLSGCASGRSAFKRGTDLERARDYDAALAEYTVALQSDPGNIEYRLKYEQTRFNAAFKRFETGRRAMEAGNLEVARTEFSRALEIDPTNAMAAQELAKLKEVMDRRSRNLPDPAVEFEELQAVTRTNPDVSAQLEPTQTGTFNLAMTQDSRIIYENLARLAGLNVIFDTDFRGTRIPIELNNVDIYEALDVVAMQTNTFWKPINRTTIVVAPENTNKRRQYEEMILKTIYLSNSITSTEITEAITALRTLLNMRFLAQSTSMNAIIVRDTPDRIAIAEKIVEDLDKSKAEVVVEATVLEVDRNQLRELGILPPSGTTLTYTTPGTSGATANNQVPLRDFEAINTQNFSIAIPQTVARFLATANRTKLAQTPSIRASDGKLAQLRIGQRVPVPSGSFQPAFVGATGTPVVQFQYIDVGVNLDITPRVLLNREVALTVIVVVSALAGDRDVGGAILPVISNRQITHEIRLKEGETNILGGIITETESTTFRGLPGLKDIPILKYLFSQETRNRDESEIIIMLTPHIIRMPKITELNMRGLPTGTELNPRLRAPGAPDGAPEAPPVPPPAAVPGVSRPLPEAPQPPPPEPRPTNASLSFAPSPVALAGAATPLNVSLTGDNIFGVDLTFSFDPQAIKINEIREGGFLSRDGQVVAIVQRLETENGMARVSLERPPGAPPLSGNGTIVTLILERGPRTGDTVLRITDFRVRDAQQTVQIGKPAEVRVNSP